MSEMKATGSARAATEERPAVLACSADEQAALELWNDLARATAVVRSRVAERLDAELGMLPEEVELLLNLEAASERRLRMADVSRLMLLSKSGVTRLVDRLVERGLVERAACPRDRRVVYAGLTGEGRQVLAEAAPLLRAYLIEHLGRHLRPHQLGAVRAALRTILVAEGVGA